MKNNKQKKIDPRKNRDEGELNKPKKNAIQRYKNKCSIKKILGRTVR